METARLDLIGAMGLKRGATKRFRVSFSDDNDLPLNLTGVVAEARISKCNAHVANFACTIADAVNGEIELLMTAAATQALMADRYFWDLFLTFPGGGDTYSPLEGSLDVRERAA